MRPFLPDFTAAELRDLLDYDPLTGIFIWRPRPGKGAWKFHNAGQRAGVVNVKGYVQIQLGRRKYQGANLAWYYVTGAWPCGSIDHINRVRDDNRIENLRDATPSQQSANTGNRPTQIARGVSFHNNRFRAGINCNGEFKYLGTFTTVDEAVAAYNAAAGAYWGDAAVLSEVTTPVPDCRVKFRWGDGCKPRLRIPKELQKKRGRRVGYVMSAETKAKISASKLLRRL